MATLLSSLAAALASKAAGSLYDWLKETLQKTAAGSPKHFQELLTDLSCRSSHNIRQTVEKWATGPKIRDRISVVQREELIALLINLTRSGRTTCSALGSSVKKHQDLLKLLLANIQPGRRHGEPVGVGWHDWKLERFLGKGSFGEVWRGRNMGHPERRAFKFFMENKAKEWLKREQETLYHLQAKLRAEPNVIQFLDVIISDQKYPFLVLEYVGGGSLEDWILSKPAERVALQKDEVIEGIVRGLARAHDQKVHHRDLKPANILLTEGSDPQPKIADFGLGEVEAETLTASGSMAVQAMVVGTNMYLPPEALDPFAKRHPAKDDVFALGVLWYQLLVERLERPPYDYPEQLQQVGADSGTIRLISRCLAAPHRRFSDATELESELETTILPPIQKVSPGKFDVQYLVREYLSIQAR
jgi:serine/threonine protein kinase